MRKKQKNPTAKSAQEAGFLPDFCTLRSLLITIVSAELLTMMLTLSANVASSHILHELSLRSLFIQWIALTSAALLCLFRPWLNRQGHIKAAILAWLIIQCVTLAVSETAFQLFSDGAPAMGVTSSHSDFLFRSLGISIIVTALGLHYLHIQFLWRQQAVAESQARLQALQSRIRPHFLFNSMNTIASLTRTRPEVAEEAILDLADLFRASLSSAATQSTLGDELELARGYLRIEKQRLGDRIQIEWDLDELPENAVIPQLILQPLLENAVYHGIEPSPAGGKIQITGRYRRGRVNLGIRNSQPSEKSTPHSSGNHMALENIRQRLEGLFSGEAHLTMSEIEGDYQVRLVFPHPWKP